MKTKIIPKHELTPELKAHFREVEVRSVARDKDMKTKKKNDKMDKEELSTGIRDYGYECEDYDVANVDGVYRAVKNATSRKVLKDFISKHGLTDEMLDKLINVEVLMNVTGKTEDELVAMDCVCEAIEQVKFTLKKKA